jgi:hypothetical protein
MLLFFQNFSELLSLETAIYAALGGIGALVGALVRVVRRRRHETGVKYNFAALCLDLFEILVWVSVGGYFAIVLQIIKFPFPWLIFMITPYMPKAWDLFEEHLPEFANQIWLGFKMMVNGNRDGKGKGN